jgi:uncharacterized protein (TIGR02147 family)
MAAEQLLTQPSIFEYSDYRLYLKDFYASMKARNSRFSFRYFAGRAGFTSPNFLKLVMEGQRNLSDDSITRLAHAFKLSQQEAEFFGHLVRFNQAKTPILRSESAELMLRTREFLKMYPLQQAEFAYYANWYYIPVRELTGMPGFQENPSWIAGRLRPRITSAQAAQALKDLELLGLLTRDENGVLRQAHRTVITGNEVSSTAVARYHRDMIHLAAEAINEVPRMKREISAACVPVSAETAGKIKTMIQEFRQKILSVANEDGGGGTIYQINMQLFPLSDWDEREGEAS